MSDYLTDIVGSEEFCNIEYMQLLQTVSSWTADIEMLPRILFTSYWHCMPILLCYGVNDILLKNLILRLLSLKANQPNKMPHFCSSFLKCNLDG